MLTTTSCGLEPEPGEELSGGDTTVFDTSRDAFARLARNTSKERLTDFFVGNSFFNANWVIAPASTGKRDGLGPVFNAVSCSGCHFKDGRGRPPLSADEPMLSMLIRLSIPGKGPNGGPKPEPTYGGQLNPKGILGVPGEGKAKVTYTEIKGTFADGTPYTLRKPKYEFVELQYGPMAKNVLFSPRVAPPVHGLGLLEAVLEKTILSFADPDDKDGDGISGRPNMVWDVQKKKTVLGRFGWKANQPSLMQQNAGAFAGDIGITSPLFPTPNCTDKQEKCKKAMDGGKPELPMEKLVLVTRYTQTLAVPARRDWDNPKVLQGKELFKQAKCASCHIPKMTTGVLKDVPEVSNQVIRPYTDLLLHDMGPELADNRPDFQATGREWRTPPLWGIGLVQNVNRHTLFLHDGRARNLSEAILWHGGEGKASKEAYLKMTKEQREALLAFLNSL
jgi:CxxC motif-containing protein (DUF1111 family)